MFVHLPPLDHEVARRLEEVVRALITEEPVVALHGPRTVGKSTLLDRVAGGLGQPRLDLDDPATRVAVEADPALFASAPSPVLVDEYQHVPDLLDAIKAELTRDLPRSFAPINRAPTPGWRHVSCGSPATSSRVAIPPP